MKEFDITIAETLKRTVTVEADSREAAEDMVEENWRNGEYVLDADDSKEVDFFTEAEREVPTLEVLIIEPYKPPREATISNRLKSLQEVVGGYIEVVRPFDENVILLCNEEGKFMGLPPNRGIKGKNYNTDDLIVGTFILCGARDEEFVSLTAEQKERFIEMFKDPEYFVQIGDEVCLVDDSLFESHAAKAGWER